MKNKIWFNGGLLLIAAALCFTIYNFWEEKRAGDRAEEILRQYQVLCEEPGHTETADMHEETDKMASVLVDNALCVGILEIPALEVSLPVLKDWSYANLKTAPCRYKGSVQQDDLIIAGHNYRSHFGGLRSLQADDEVLFTDVEGTLHAYQVVLVERLSGEDVEGMEAGEWDLTLFTCTTDSQSRVTVRCMRIEAQGRQE